MGCRGRAITPEALSAAYEISGRALSHAERVLNGPAAALSAFEETAATVSGMLSKQEVSSNIPNLPGHLFRAFLDLQIRLDAGDAVFTFEKRMFWNAYES